MADIYMRNRYFNTAVDNLKRKMQALEAEAEALRAKDVLTCLRAANEAWDREVEIAKLQQQIGRECRKAPRPCLTP